MDQTHFPILPDATLAAINTHGTWLAQDDLSDSRPNPDATTLSSS